MAYGDVAGIPFGRFVPDARRRQAMVEWKPGGRLAPMLRSSRDLFNREMAAIDRNFDLMPFRAQRMQRSSRRTRPARRAASLAARADPSRPSSPDRALLVVGAAS